MYAGMSNVDVSHATIDAGGIVLTADPAIATLNQHSGGAIGAPLAVPALATVVRLARRLGIVVSRGIVVGDDAADLDLWVRAQPEGETVRLAISGWRERRSKTSTANEEFAAAETGADLRWDVDASLRFTFVSIEAARRVGIDALALLGKPLTMLFTLDDRGVGLPLLDAVAMRRPLQMQHADLRGTGRKMILSGVPRESDDGDFAGFSGIAQFVEAPEPAKAGPISLDLAKGLERALRRPIARIIANADTINAEADGPVNPGYASYAADIAAAGRHLLSLVDDLVDVETIEQKDFALTKEPLDLADVARRAAGLMSVRASDSGVVLERPTPALSAPALGDFRRALQIMVNLIGNAIRYAPAQSTVVVTTEVRGDAVAAIVSDQGRGIALADQDQIFGKFERLDPAEAGGSGLGLYIARRLARAMGGDITVESAPGEGARFTLTLPARQPEI